MILAATLRDLGTCHFVGHRQNVVIAGPKGIGRSLVVQAIGHEVCRRGSEALSTKTHRLLEGLLDKEYPLRAALLCNRVRSVSLLILECSGLRSGNPPEAELLYVICDERLGSRLIILASNRPAQSWYSVVPEPVNGGAILDRVASAVIKLIAGKGPS